MGPLRRCINKVNMITNVTPKFVREAHDACLAEAEERRSAEILHTYIFILYSQIKDEERQQYYRIEAEREQLEYLSPGKEAERAQSVAREEQRLRDKATCSSGRSGSLQVARAWWECLFALLTSFRRSVFGWL